MLYKYYVMNEFLSETFLNKNHHNNMAS